MKVIISVFKSAKDRISERDPKEQSACREKLKTSSDLVEAGEEFIKCVACSHLVL